MTMRNPLRMLWLMAALVAAGTHAQTYDRAAVDMLRTLQKQPTTLARCQYLGDAIPGLSPTNRMLAQQMLSFCLSELGMYTQAVLGFPLKMREIPDLVLPDPSRWRAEDAADAIAGLARDRRLVLINEVHHNAQTRVLTLALLPRLRALGFTHLALEALGTDAELARRGYPVQASGTEYLQEPLYAEIVREALKLGFVLVPYDTPGNAVEDRETGQAENLFRRVFQHDPGARLVVAAGYAHIDKQVGRLGATRPMAMTLARLTGLPPLSIDQSQFVESRWADDDDYHRLAARFPSGHAQVLVDKATHTPWSAAPELYDVSVILPPVLSRRAFGEQEMAGPWGGRYRNLRNGVQGATDDFIALNEMLRPDWLALDGQRRPVPIDTRLCRNRIPCAIEARYAGESDQATPADCYAFFQSSMATRLYLRPGRYRLRASNVDGRTLSQSVIDVPAH